MFVVCVNVRTSLDLTFNSLYVECKAFNEFSKLVDNFPILIISDSCRNYL